MTGPVSGAGEVVAFERWFERLFSVHGLTELGVLLLCFGVAWVAVWLLRRKRPEGESIWLGSRGYDGVLFPVIALVAALLSRWLLRYAPSGVVFGLAVPILWSLLIIRMAVRVLRAAFPKSLLVRRFERTFSWLVWIGMVMWVSGLLPVLLAEMEGMQWQFGGVKLSLRAIIEGALTAGAVMVLMLWLSSAIESQLLRDMDQRPSSEVSVRKMAANAARALLLLVGLLVALSAAGIPLGALSVVGGAVGVGIGFGLQKLAANYVSGFVILAERSLRIGDMVKVDNFEGRITDITTRYTVIRSASGRESIVPNEMLITSRIENLSLADRNLLLSTVVQVAYGCDVEAVMKRLGEVARGVPRVLADPEPAARLTNFAADGLELTLYFWISDPENGQANVRSDLNLAILRALADLGVEIPFPQRVMHTRIVPEPIQGSN